jgi:hypothetical protein
MQPHTKPPPTPRPSGGAPREQKDDGGSPLFWGALIAVVALAFFGAIGWANASSPARQLEQMVHTDQDVQGNTNVNLHPGACSNTLSWTNPDGGVDWCQLVQGVPNNCATPQTCQVCYELSTNVDLVYRTTTLPDGGTAALGDRMLAAESTRSVCLGGSQTFGDSFTTFTDAGAVIYTDAGPVPGGVGAWICIHQFSTLVDAGSGNADLTRCY